MPNVKLPRLIGGEYDFKTESLPYEQAGQYGRGLGGVNSDQDPVREGVHPGQRWPHQAVH